MSGRPRKGRPVAFSPITPEPVQPDPVLGLKFTIEARHGGTVLIDMAALDPRPLAIAFAGALPKESVVDVCAEVTCPDVPISSCSQQLVELQVKKIFCVSRSVPELPLQLEDAARPEKQAEMHLKASKAVEPVDAARALELMMRACSIYEREDKLALSTEAFHTCLNALVRTRKLRAAIELVEAGGKTDRPDRIGAE